MRPPRDIIDYLQAITNLPLSSCYGLISKWLKVYDAEHISKVLLGTPEGYNVGYIINKLKSDFLKNTDPVYENLDQIGKE